MGNGFRRRKFICGAQCDGQRGSINRGRSESEKRASKTLASTRGANRFRPGPGNLFAAGIAGAANRMNGAKRKGCERHMRHCGGRLVRAPHRCRHRVFAVLAHGGSFRGRAGRCGVVRGAGGRPAERTRGVARGRPCRCREQKARQHRRDGFLEPHRRHYTRNHKIGAQTPLGANPSSNYPWSRRGWAMPHRLHRWGDSSIGR
jgi:hypothetical protein